MFFGVSTCVLFLLVYHHVTVTISSMYIQFVYNRGTNIRIPSLAGPQTTNLRDESPRDIYFQEDNRVQTYKKSTHHTPCYCSSGCWSIFDQGRHEMVCLVEVIFLGCFPSHFAVLRKDNGVWCLGDSDQCIAGDRERAENLG